VISRQQRRGCACRKKELGMKVQVVGKQFDFTFGEQAIYRLHFLDAKHLEVTVIADSFYAAGTLNHFEIEMTEIRPDVYMVTWVEPATGNTVTHLDDFATNVAYTNITDLKSKSFWRLKGEIRPLDGAR
jgi:phenolic acid decarboxylase